MISVNTSDITPRFYDNVRCIWQSSRIIVVFNNLRAIPEQARGNQLYIYDNRRGRIAWLARSGVLMNTLLV